MQYKIITTIIYYQTSETNLYKNNGLREKSVVKRQKYYAYSISNDNFALCSCSKNNIFCIWEQWIESQGSHYCTSIEEKLY